MQRLVPGCILAVILSAPAIADEYRHSSVFSDYMPQSAARATPVDFPAGAQALVLQLGPEVTLAPASVAAQSSLEALAARNAALRGGPRNDARSLEGRTTKALQNGFERTLPRPLGITLGEGRFTESISTQSLDRRTSQLRATKIQVDGAGQLRLRLARVQLKPGAKLWVSNELGDLSEPFGNELIDMNGDLWTPSVFGQSITLLVDPGARGGGASLDIVSVVEIFALDDQQQPRVTAGPKAAPPGCQEDARCFDEDDFSAIEQARSAIGTIIFQSGPDSFVCSGALINDTNPDSFVPLFLTANHCLSSGTEASSVEVFWDNFRSSCNGTEPSLGSRPRSNGSSLLASSASGDYTLLELDNVPGGRWFLGWDRDESAVQAGTILHRLSSPGGDPQVYSRSVVNGSPDFLCPGLPRDTFLYQTQLLGGTDGGSSGAPIMLNTGQIVGQLYGDCGDNPEEVCNYENLNVDGKLAAYFSALSPWLDPQVGATPAALTISSVRAERGSFATGSTIAFENTVRNTGGMPSASYQAVFYLSADTIINDADIVLGTSTRDPLPAGGRHDRVSNLTVPAAVDPGEYYVGMRITGNTGSSTAYDPVRVEISSNEFLITPAINGAWADQTTDGQGLLIEVFPGLGKMFVAWFTFDTTRPGPLTEAQLGGAGQRWMTGFGDISGNRAQLDLANSVGGVFDQASPAVLTQDAYGFAEIVFQGCNSATLTYIIPAIGQSGTLSLQRLALDATESCESINTLLSD